MSPRPPLSLAKLGNVALPLKYAKYIRGLPTLQRLRDINIEF